jgi:beta-ureidopropionase / N-carbamoyl-L-amino-acid hydrolase
MASVRGEQECFLRFPAFRIFSYLRFMRKALLLAAAAILFGGLSSVYAQIIILANQARIESRIKALALIGDTSLGIRKRVAYSTGDIAARKYITGLMQSAGLSVRVDAGGNIVGSRKGANASLRPIVLGSHTDAVPNGGIYDGDLGVIGALECIELLNENHLVTDHPLEVIDFVDEEGGLTGSEVMIGGLTTARLGAITNSGKTIRQGIADLGGDPDQLEKAVRRKGDIEAYLELHIEQGGNLEREKRDIGIVEGIVGLDNWTIVVAGTTNHAGTTPMPGRKDALVTASKLVVLVNEIALRIPGRQVATVGQMNVFPGASNVIPGKVVMSLDVRDLSRQKLDSVFGLIRQAADSLGGATGATISLTPKSAAEPAIADKKIRELISLAAGEAKLSTLSLPSGAGHDAQDMARIAPMGMIFVPSKGGISHTPDEYTAPKDMANGATVLFGTLMKLDKN